MEDPLRKALEAQRRIIEFPDQGSDLRKAIEANKAVYEMPEPPDIQKAIEASQRIYSTPDVQESIRKAIEASKAVYEMPEPPDIQKAIEASQRIYSTPDVQESIRKAIEASKAVYEMPAFTGNLRKALSESAEAVRGAGERLQERELAHDAESVPGPSDPVEIWNSFLGGLSPLGRLVVLNAMVGLLQALLFQVESSSHTDVPNTLQAGVLWAQAIVDAIIALMSAEKKSHEGS